MNKLAVVIVESRNIPDLVDIIQKKHLDYLPNYAQLIIFHSKENEVELKAAFPKSGFSLLEGLNSLQHYNEVLCNPKFWEQLVEYQFVLIMQADSQILRTGIEEFVEAGFDYYGAVWGWEPIVGNGGLSLRNPRVMLETLTRFGWDGHTNEDVWICNLLKAHPEIGKLSPKELAQKFSVETIFSLGSWGVHSPEKWLPKEQVDILLNQYLV